MAIKRCDNKGMERAICVRFKRGALQSEPFSLRSFGAFREPFNGCILIPGHSRARLQSNRIRLVEDQYDGVAYRRARLAGDQRAAAMSLPPQRVPQRDRPPHPPPPFAIRSAMLLADVRWSNHHRLWWARPRHTRPGETHPSAGTDGSGDRYRCALADPRDPQFVTCRGRKHANNRLTLFDQSGPNGPQPGLPADNLSRTVDRIDHHSRCAESRAGLSTVSSGKPARLRHRSGPMLHTACD